MDSSEIGVGWCGDAEGGINGVPGERGGVCMHENIAKLEKTPADGTKAILNVNVAFGITAFRFGFQ